MAVRLLAIVLVLLLSRVWAEGARWRESCGFQFWLEKTSGFSAVPALVLGIGVPVLICALLAVWLKSLFFGLATLVFDVVVLYLCWGPRDLERDVESVLEAGESERGNAARAALRANAAAIVPGFTVESLVEAVFTAALQRWFGVLFWFVLLGPAGALLYRLAQQLAYASFAADDVQARARRLSLLLDLPPAHLVALSLALVSDFDAVFQTWHAYRQAHGKGYWSVDLGFLAAIAQASVAADVVADDELETPRVALQDAMVLVRRVLVAWLTLIALVVVGGWVT
jgi:AmpE protein